MKSFKKIFGIIFITFVLFLSIISIVWFSSASNSIMDQAIDRALREHESLRYIATQRTESILNETHRPFIEEDIRRTLQSEYTIGTQSGKIVNESKPHSEFGPLYIRDGLSKNDLWLKTYQSSHSNKAVLVTQETFDTNIMPLTISLRYDLSDTVQVINSLYNNVILSIIGGIIVTGFTSIILARYITRPTESIIGAIDKIKDGKLDTKVDLTQIESKQAAFIAKNFNDMMITINSRLTRLEELNDSQKNFIAYLSHEIKTPLTTILGYTQQLLGEIHNDEQLQSLVAIYSEARRLKDISLTLLKVYDKEKHTLEYSSLGPDWFEGEIKKICQSTGQKYSLDISKDRCLFDDSLLYIVLLNVLINAIEAADDKDATISIKSKKFEKNYIITVENPINHTKIRPKQGNFGIGLSIVKRIMDLHHGSFLSSFSETHGQVKIIIPDRSEYEKI